MTAVMVSPGSGSMWMHLAWFFRPLAVHTALHLFSFFFFFLFPSIVGKKWLRKSDEVNRLTCWSISIIINGFGAQQRNWNLIEPERLLSSSIYLFFLFIFFLYMNYFWLLIIMFCWLSFNIDLQCILIYLFFVLIFSLYELFLII